MNRKAVRCIMEPNITTTDLQRQSILKYGPAESRGWTPNLRNQFGYYTPDDWYETLMDQLVTPSTRWLEVGCGRSIFPSNPALAARLSQRCARLVGVDESENIAENPYIHAYQKAYLEDFQTDEVFDLISLRMVAEHVRDPDRLATALTKLLAPGGRVVIYTVHRWSPVSIVAFLTPMAVHHAVKGLIWEVDPRDTFPVEYRMNTRRQLSRLFAKFGFEEKSYRRLSDCRTLQKWKLTNYVELLIWKMLQVVGLNYPEVCILATYGWAPGQPNASSRNPQA
jgi:2-polyprenyl-3-methyl-5-hydroxy-6-metoxy-1,4-benzoquinol methylase